MRKNKFFFVCGSRLHRILLPENIERFIFSWSNKFYSSISCRCVFNSLWEISSFLPVTRLFEWNDTLLHFLWPFTVYLMAFHFVTHLLWMKSIYFAMNESKDDGPYTIESIFNVSNNTIGYIFFFRSIFISRIASLHSCQIISFISEWNIFRFKLFKHRFLLWRNRNLFFLETFIIQKAILDSHVDSWIEIISLMREDVNVGSSMVSKVA